jgi:hypothetical protein
MDTNGVGFCRWAVLAKFFFGSFGGVFKSGYLRIVADLRAFGEVTGLRTRGWRAWKAREIALAGGNSKAAALLPQSKTLAREGERPGLVVSPRVAGLN